MEAQAGQRSLAGLARGTLLRLGGPATTSDVEDILEEAFLNAAQRLKNDPDLHIENMAGWFRRVLFYTCIAYCRTSRRERRHFSRELDGEDHILDLIDRSTSLDLHVAINEALDCLPKDDRALVELAAEGHTSEEIAKTLGIVSAAAVRKRKSRVLATLQKMLGGVTSWMK